MALDLATLLGRGYFPKELPPPFNTTDFGNKLAANENSLPKEFKSRRLTKACNHNLARAGTLRRKLAIPNPINYFQLGQFVVRHWTDLEALASKSKISLSKPQCPASGRAIAWTPHHDLPKNRVKVRSLSRYILRTDISRFYPSIYTHSIPWAIHSKATAKANRSASLFGNELDALVRNAQDGQTLGLPIGPDISLLISEILAASVDEVVCKNRSVRGFRHIDDYEIGVLTQAEADEFLNILQEALNEYELALNPSKTKIVTLPAPAEATWVTDLRLFPIRNSARAQHGDLLAYFDKAFQLSKGDSDEHIIRFALGRIARAVIHKDSWDLLQDLLLQSSLVEAGALSHVLDLYVAYAAAGYPLDKDRIAESLNQIIKQHAPQGHGSEVAWAIWSSITLGVPINDDAALAICKIEDSVVSLLALDAWKRGHIRSTVVANSLQNFMTEAELMGAHWLLSYEASVKGWLPSIGGQDHIATNPCFNYLRAQGVSFYNAAAATPPKPLQVAKVLDSDSYDDDSDEVEAVELLYP